ncbi:MAG TPA: hypothetical protein VFG30_33565 [Polyangiales bacterium]|nr:hypothetical protein [Polyangiales bacterium]
MATRTARPARLGECFIEEDLAPEIDAPLMLATIRKHCLCSRVRRRLVLERIRFHMIRVHVSVQRRQ